MGCQRERFDHDRRSDQCIRDIVRRILEAQREAVDECVTSCENSIEDLVSQRVRRRRNDTTIPFMLICKEDCKPFVGAGFVNRDRGRRDFECIESPILRVRDFVRGSRNCVNVELLLPVGRRRDGEHHGEEHGEEREHHDHHHHKDSFCDKFGRRRIRNFRETGVCITLDLDCFCGITCLDPITPEPL